MELTIGFGSAPQNVTLPDANVMDVLTPNSVEITSSGQPEVVRALNEPIGTPKLSELAVGKKKVAIVSSDITRPMPTWTALPPVLAELDKAGVRREDITVVLALGSHRTHTDAEKKKLLGECYGTVRCVDSSDEGYVHMGVTPSGTPVDIAKAVAEADFRICMGNIEYHYFAGYSGGAKAIMPGVSTRDAIQANHRHMVEDGAVAGRLEGNPLREDIEASLSCCPVDFILNVVLDEHKQIVRAVAGDVTLAHREGCRFLDKFYRKEIPQLADIVIVSQGGAPKDLNLYQTQKALDNAKHAVKPGGIVVLVGSCREGLGEKTFEEWMTGAQTPEELVDRIRRDFKLGGHKAAAIALVLRNADIYLVSEMEDAFVESIFMKPFHTVQEAVDAAFAAKGPDARVLVMPYGGSTLPVLVSR
jgi:nickel-dependent lactate racemase